MKLISVFSNKINIHLRESINIGLGEALGYRQRNRNELREIKRLVESGQTWEQNDVKSEVVQVHLNCLQVRSDNLKPNPSET